MEKKIDRAPVLLIAEDDPDDQALMQSVIEDLCAEDVQLQFVQDGFELMGWLRPSRAAPVRPDLLILDLNLPGKDGRAALRELKADPRLLDIPVVVLTTSIDLEDFRYCQQHGVTGFYRKPNTLSGLEAIFSYLCREYL